LVSPEFIAKIVVTDVNIAPVIISQKQNPIIITVNDIRELNALTDFEITDPDSDPNDRTLVVSEGTNYTVSGPNQNIITPTANYTGPLEVVVSANDGKATGPPFTVQITVALPSADPLITGQGLLIIKEDVSLTLQFEDLLVTDLDDSDYPAGFTMNIQPGKDYSVNNRLITPALNYNGFLRVEVTVNDGGRTSKPFTLTIYVEPVNDAPEITVLETDPIAYEPGTGPIPITEIFECVDVDSDFLQLAQIGIIDSLYSASNDELIFENVDTSPIRGVYDAARGVLSLLGHATSEDYIAAIRSIKYNYRLTLDNSGNQTPISTSSKKVFINLSDGTLVSENKERAIELRTSVELSIPNTFTPNGDSENNTWAVQPITKTDQFNKTVVRVYNKRGLLVYESVGLEKEWDGTFNGELLPVDTYYYTIDLKLSFIKKTYKGAVMILR
jgi:gliding motility-associated-like protein